MPVSASYKHAAQCKSSQVTNVPHVVTPKRTLAGMSQLRKRLLRKKMQVSTDLKNAPKVCVGGSESRVGWMRISGQLTNVPVTGDGSSRTTRAVCPRKPS